MSLQRLFSCSRAQVFSIAPNEVELTRPPHNRPTLPAPGDERRGDLSVWHVSRRDDEIDGVGCRCYQVSSLDPVCFLGFGELSQRPADVTVPGVVPEPVLAGLVTADDWVVDCRGVRSRLLGCELSQQPICPQAAQRRRCTHQPCARRHSTHPVPLGTAVSSIPAACSMACSFSDRAVSTWTAWRRAGCLRVSPLTAIWRPLRKRTGRDALSMTVRHSEASSYALGQSTEARTVEVGLRCRRHMVSGG